MPRPVSARKTTTAIAGRSAVLTHRHEDVRAFVPGPYNRKENKPLDQGARYEEAVKDDLRLQGLGAWRNPGVRLQRRSAKGLVPDLGVYSPKLTGLVSPLVPDVPGRPLCNALGSIKSQNTTGSAEHKIETEIVDMAFASDISGVPAFVVIDGPVFSAGQLEQWRQAGEDHQVVVMTREELTAERLEAALVRMARRRRSLHTRRRPNGTLLPRKGTYRFTQYETRYGERLRHFKKAQDANESFS